MDGMLRKLLQEIRLKGSAVRGLLSLPSLAFVAFGIWMSSFDAAAVENRMPDGGALTPWTAIGPEGQKDRPSLQLRNAIAEMARKGVKGRKGPESVAFNGGGQAGRETEIWKLLRQLLLYRLRLLGVLWDHRTALQTELKAFGEVPVQSARLDETTRNTLNLDKSIPDGYVFLDFYRQHVSPHEVVLADTNPSSGDENLAGRIREYLSESLRLLDFDREISMENSKLIPPPAGLNLAGREPITDALVEKIRVRTAYLRDAQRSLISLPSLYQPIAAQPHEVENLNPEYYWGANAFLSEDKTSSYKLHTYNDLAFLALANRAYPGYQLPAEFPDISQDSLAPEIRRLARKTIVESLRKGLKQNEDALLSAYRMTEAGIVERLTRGLLGVPDARAIGVEPDDADTLFGTLLSLTPVFADDEALAASFEAEYGIPVKEQVRVNAFLSDFMKRRERKDRHLHQSSRTMSMIVGVGIVVIAIPTNGLGLALMYGACEALYWYSIDSERYLRTRSMARIARGLFYSVRSSEQVKFDVEDLEHVTLLEKQALDDYLLGAAMLGLDVAGVSYLRFVRKARLFGKTTLALETMELERLEPRTRQVAAALKELEEFAAKTDDLAAIHTKIIELKGAAAPIAKTLTGREVSSVQKLSDALWRTRGRLDGEIQTLIQRAQRTELIVGEIRHPKSLFLGEKGFFELGSTEFQVQLEKVVNLMPEGELRNRYRRLLLQRWACEEAQAEGISALTSPKNHPFVRNISKGVRLTRDAKRGAVKWIRQQIGRSSRASAAMESARETQFVTRLDDFRVWLTQQKGYTLGKKFFGEMNWGFTYRFRNQYVTKGFIRRFLQSERDLLIWGTAGELKARGDRFKEEFPEYLLNIVIGTVQNVGQTFTSRANVTMSRRFQVGSALTMATATISSIMFNRMRGEDFFEDDECLAAVLKRGAGNADYAVFSEVKARLSEGARLAFEREMGTGHYGTTLVVTGTNIASKTLGSWIWVKTAKAVQMQGKCPEIPREEANDPELRDLLLRMHVLANPNQTPAFMASMGEGLGAIYGETNDIYIPGVPDDLNEFVEGWNGEQG